MKRKISAVLALSMIATNASPVLNVYASEVVKEKVKLIEEKVISEAKIKKFDLNNYSNFEGYNSEYRVLRDEIKSISNNGGNYGSSSIDKAIDGNLSTHWETGKSNSSEFKNEIVVEFNDIETIDRIAYATRQDGAKGKGFPTEFDIYASVSGNDEDLKLVSSGQHSSTGNMLEFKFDTITAKKVKFVFKEANQGWASASEFWFYKEDKQLDKMNKIFTDETRTTLSEEFNTIDKLSKFEEEVKSHPFYENIIEDLNDAKLILEGNTVVYKDAIVSKFKNLGSSELVKYDELFKVQPNKITTNGGHYGSSNVEKAIDGKADTSWHSGKQNNNDFTNEVILTLDEITTLDRIVYTGGTGTHRGFAESFDIYASKTSKGDSFELVSKGSANRTNDSIEIKFNPTQFKRVKFVFKKGYENWALASEFGLYKVDAINDKMGRLFTDSSMNTVSEEFNTVEKITELENEVKNHPFYEDYKEDLKNAKELIGQGTVQATTTKVKSFRVDGKLLEEYNKVFRIDNENIKSIKTNGGHYGSSNIEKAIDGDINTSWHSGKQNDSKHTNEVVIELNEITELNRIMYSASRGTSRGFATEFDIYTSVTSSGDNFKLVSSGKTSPTQETLELKFEPTKFKRVKFVFKQGYENWACAGEFELYKEDSLVDKIENLFTNGLMNELKPEYNSLEIIEDLEKEVKKHPLSSMHLETINMAKEIFENPQKYAKSQTLEQRGNSPKKTSERKMRSFQDWQVTGLTAKPGDTIEVYVDVKEGEPMPSLVYKQSINRHGNFQTFSLNQGKNTIVIPEYDNVRDDVAEGVIFGGAVYLTNYESDEQTEAPKVRIVGGEKYPAYKHGETDPQEILKELDAYAKKVKADPENVVDLFDLSSDKAIVTVQATFASEWFKKNNKTPEHTANRWDFLLEKAYEFWGYDNSGGVNDKFDARVVFMTKNITGSTFMNAAGGFVGVRPTSQDAILGAGTGWGVIHEIGHLMDTGGRTIVELTNNILPIYLQTVDNGESVITKSNYWNTQIYPKVTKKNYQDNIWTNDDGGWDSYRMLSPLWQLHLNDNSFYPKFEQAYRANDFKLSGVDGVAESYIRVASEIMQEDLTEFFSRHGIQASEETKKLVSKYPKATKKYHYINDKLYNYEGNGFEGDIGLNVSSDINSERAILNFDINKEQDKHLVGYEIIKDGEVIGFTNNESFTDTNVDLNTNSVYEVKAYDTKLNASKPVKISLYQPNILVKQNKVTLGLNEEFNPLDFVKVINLNGESLQNKVKVESNVDTTKHGNYTIKYTVEDENLITEKVLPVEVVSSYDYLSDTEWTSSKTQWGSPRRNSNIKTNTLNEVTTFDKGLASHANGEFVYDLGEHKYDRFEALLGVDLSVAGNPASSLTFKIIGDGKVLATTKVMKHTDNAKYISVPISGVKELKIELHDGGNGNASDRGVIANPKLTTNDSKPVINADNLKIVKGTKFDAMADVTAKDAEDGDLTNKIELVSNNFKENTLGKFEVVYRTADKNGNVVEKKRYITVYDVVEAAKSKYGSMDNLEAYNAKYKIPVESVSNNGGNYSGSPIEKAIDNNRSTHWETSRPNEGNFKNEVIFDLGEIKEIDRMAYAARNGGKGFAKEFSIYTSTKAEGNDFTLVYDGSYNGNINDVITMETNEMQARRVKFVFDNAHNSWASIGEMSFYSKDEIMDKVNSIFVDSDKKEVSEEYNTLEKLNALHEEAKNHEGYKFFKEDFDKAKELIRASLPTITLDEELTTVKLNSEFDLREGVEAKDIEDGNLSDVIEIKDNGFTTTKAGKYTIEYSVTDSDNNTVTKSKEILVYSDISYVSDNKYTIQKSGWGGIKNDKAPAGNEISVLVNGQETIFEKGIGAHANSEITFDLTGKEYEYFTSVIGIDANARGNANASAKYKVLVDGSEVFESNIFKSNDDSQVITIPVNGAKEIKLITDQANQNDWSDQTVWADAKFLVTNSKPSIVTEDMTIEVGTDVDINQNVSASDAEDGDLTSKIEIVSNNFKENTIGRFEVVYKVTDSDGNVSEKTRYITAYEALNVNKSKYGSFTNLDSYNEQYKIPVVSAKNNAGNYGSDVIGRSIDNNLNTHWETNSPNNDKFKNEVVFDLGESKEINRMSYAARKGGKGFATSFSVYTSNESEGNDFILAGKGSYSGNTNDVIEFKLNKTEAKRVKFVFDTARDNWASIGEISFYTEDKLADKVESLFTDSNKTEVSKEYNTLDKLNALKEEVKNHQANELFQEGFDKAEELIRTSFPTLNIPKSQSVKLGETIEDLIGEVSASDTKDGDLSSNVEVSGIENVNFNKTGEYELTYSVTDSDENSVSKTRKISVVDMNDFTYLTTYDWKSANTGWGSVTKDNSVSKNGLRLTGENGEVVSFEKGIGTHSTSTITYDLNDKNYERFSSYVGVDRAMYNSVGSIQFEVYVDGEKVFDSGVMNSKDKMKFIDVDIADAKELKLVVKDGGNGNGSDHATWGDAKLHFANIEGIEINRQELDILLEELSNLNEAMYTQESFDKVKVALEEVKESLKDGYNQSEIDKLVAKLNEVKEQLEVVISEARANLQKLVDYGDTLDISMVGATTHVQSRWDNFVYMKDIAKEVLADFSKTDEELNTTILQLNYHIEELHINKANISG